MTAAATPTCTGCTHLETRHRRGNKQTWCKRYERLAADRCIDYRSKRITIIQSLRYLAQSSIK